MHLLKACLFQFFHKLLHITVQRLLCKHILQSKCTAFFQDTECLSYHISFILCRPYLMEYKVADNGIKSFICKIKACRISLLEAYSVRNLFHLCILFTLLLCIAPLFSPVIHSCQFCLRIGKGAAHGKGSCSASDIQQFSLSVPGQMIYQILMYISHYIAFVKIKGLTASPHIKRIRQKDYKQHSCNPGRYSHL